ncbi:hypothetical protein [Rhodomicrobium vannielii]|nr:hypothetical protein [Rhodomicrobium vannielii]
MDALSDEEAAQGRRRNGVASARLQFHAGHNIIGIKPLMAIAA